MALYELGKAHFAINSNGTFRYLGKLINYGIIYVGKDKTTCKFTFSKNPLIDEEVIVVNYIPRTFKELEPKIIYTAEEKVAYEKEKKLVEPKEDKPSKVVYDYRGHSNVLDLIRGMLSATVIVDQKDYCDSELRNHARARNIDLVMYVDRRKETLNQDPFKLNPHEFDETKTPFSDSLDSMAYILKQIEKPYIPSLPSYFFLSFDEALHTKPPKNRIPDRVVFNQDKGKVTVLISKHMDGVAPYWAYTSKVHGDDKYDAEFGFLLSYYKYLIRRFDLKVQKEMIERIFKILKERRYVYLLGVVENEVLKINGVESYKNWEDIYLAITDPSNAKNVYNYTWDYAEWKEMLRVHELETKREEQKAIRKEIKKHEQEIEKLKKKGV